ncbi:MAG: apolipoprotein N-acyltransferase [Rhodomicrobium sp.]
MDALPKLIARLETWKLAPIAFLAGALSVLAMAPFFLWPVMFVTFPVLIWALDGVCLPGAEVRRGSESFRKRLWRAAFIGWAFGFGYFLASIYWIGYAFYVDAERYAALMPLAVAALPAGLALFYAAAAALSAALWRPGYARLSAFAFAFFCAEAARGHLLTGFPWNLFGEALAANDAHMQMAAYTGVYGLTLAALFIFPAPAALIAAPGSLQERRWMPLLVAVCALSGSYAFGSHRLLQEAGEVEGVRVRIVQPNVPQREKWKPENRNSIFERALSLSRNGTDGQDIGAFTHVIWPESSVPFLFGFNRDIFSPQARELLAALLPPQTSLILGAERAEGILSVDTRYTFNRVYNSLFVLGEGAKINAIYDKTHLVPFGEYVPLRDALTAVGMRAFSHRLDGFESGEEQAPLIQTPQAPDFLPLICYEIIFPGRVTDLRKRPGWIVNVTNDAWFGDSTGPHQHLHQARIRATEEGLPVMRAANTGISAVIDPYGRLLAKLDLGKTGVIDHGLPQALPPTFYEKTRLPLLIILFFIPLQFYPVLVVLRKTF